MICILRPPGCTWPRRVKCLFHTSLICVLQDTFLCCPLSSGLKTKQHVFLCDVCYFGRHGHPWDYLARYVLFSHISSIFLRLPLECDVSRLSPPSVAHIVCMPLVNDPQQIGLLTIEIWKRKWLSNGQRFIGLAFNTLVAQVAFCLLVYLKFLLKTTVKTKSINNNHISITQTIDCIIDKASFYKNTRIQRRKQSKANKILGLLHSVRK